MFVNERTLQLRYKLQRGYLTILDVYAPEEGKTEETQEFYETFQDQKDQINKNDYIIVAGYYNAKVGNVPIDGILGTNGEIAINNNGHKLKEFASVNELKITNTFFRHKEMHKMTWSARGHRSIKEYILTNTFSEGYQSFQGIRRLYTHLLINFPKFVYLINL
jgi:hypothetical protein